MSNEFIAFFTDNRANNYDTMMPIWTPDYEIINETVKYLFLNILPKQASILVVGSGTGTELVNLAIANPEWLITGVDPSPEMNIQAKQKIAQFNLGKRCSILEGTLSDLPPDSKFEAATLLNVLQFIPDTGYKFNMLKNIAIHLKPQGKLAIVDFFGTRGNPVFIQQQKALFQYILDRDLTNTETFESLTQGLAEVQFVSEKRLIELFLQAGFSNIQRFYQMLVTGGWLLSA